jgi:hypothetical protein
MKDWVKEILWQLGFLAAVFGGGLLLLVLAEYFL